MELLQRASRHAGRKPNVVYQRPRLECCRGRGIVDSSPKRSKEPGHTCVLAGVSCPCTWDVGHGLTRACLGMWFTEGSPSNGLDDTWKAVSPRPLASMFTSRATWTSRGNTGHRAISTLPLLFSGDFISKIDPRSPFMKEPLNSERC
jgi:hypothetical protein